MENEEDGKDGVGLEFRGGENGREAVVGDEMHEIVGEDGCEDNVGVPYDFKFNPLIRFLFLHLNKIKN